MSSELILTGHPVPSAEELAKPGALLRYFASQPEPPGGYKSTMAFVAMRAQLKMGFNANLPLTVHREVPLYDPAKAQAVTDAAHAALELSKKEQ